MVNPQMKTHKTRVLFVLIQLDAGGSERVVLDLARNLDKDKFEVFVAAFRYGVLEVDFKEVCKEVFVIHKKPGFDIGAMFQISNIVKKHHIDVVNAHHYMPCFYSFLGCCIIQRKRLIYTEHSVPEVTDVAQGRHKKIMNYMLNLIDTVVGVSQEITDTFKKHYPKHEKRFKMIVNGVDVDKFRCPEKREITRKQFGFQPDDFVVGMVANFRKVKNHVCLIRAVDCLKNDVPKLKVLLVGTGFPGDPENTEDDIRLMVEQHELLNQIVFAGYQSDIPAMLSAMDCFCLPSFSEGLPVSVLEAIAAKLVVVGSNVSGIKEVVVHSVTGYLFPSDNDEKLSQALLSVQKGDCRLDVQTHAQFTNRFGKSRWIKEMEALYLLF